MTELFGNVPEMKFVLELKSKPKAVKASAPVDVPTDIDAISNIFGGAEVMPV